MSVRGQSGNQRNDAQGGAFMKASVDALYKHRGTRFFFVRSAEEIEKVFDQWSQGAFQPGEKETRYTINDLNQPVKIPNRRNGVADYANDGPITEFGNVTAQLLGRTFRFRGITLTHIYSSPSLRCLQTAGQIAKTNQTSTKIRIEPGLFECLWWYWQTGLPNFCAPSDYAEQTIPVNSDYRPVMQVDELQWRLYKEKDASATYRRLSDVVDKLCAAHGHNDNVLVVGHAVTLDACARHLCGRPALNPTEADTRRLGLYYKYCAIVAAEQKSPSGAKQGSTAWGEYRWVPDAMPPFTYFDLSTQLDALHFNRI